MFRETAEVVGLGELVTRIEGGYADTTPGGGIHWYWRCSEIAGNTKLAARRNPTPENPHKEDTLIETRGRGGYVIVAPSNGRVHPSGKPYVRLSGGPETIVTITPEERQALFDLAKAFDERPATEIGASHQRQTVGNIDRPGDDFNA